MRKAVREDDAEVEGTFGKMSKEAVRPVSFDKSHQIINGMKQSKNKSVSSHFKSVN